MCKLLRPRDICNLSHMRHARNLYARENTHVCCSAPFNLRPCPRELVAGILRAPPIGRRRFRGFDESRGVIAPPIEQPPPSLQPSGQSVTARRRDRVRDLYVSLSTCHFTPSSPAALNTLQSLSPSPLWSIARDIAFDVLFFPPLSYIFDNL